MNKKIIISTFVFVLSISSCIVFPAVGSAQDGAAPKLAIKALQDKAKSQTIIEQLKTQIAGLNEINKEQSEKFKQREVRFKAEIQDLDYENEALIGDFVLFMQKDLLKVKVDKVDAPINKFEQCKKDVLNRWQENQSTIALLETQVSMLKESNDTQVAAEKERLGVVHAIVAKLQTELETLHQTHENESASFEKFKYDSDDRVKCLEADKMGLELKVSHLTQSNEQFMSSSLQLEKDNLQLEKANVQLEKENVQLKERIQSFLAQAHRAPSPVRILIPSASTVAASAPTSAPAVVASGSTVVTSAPAVNQASRPKRIKGGALGGSFLSSASSFSPNP